MRFSLGFFPGTFLFFTIYQLQEGGRRGGILLVLRILRVRERKGNKSYCASPSQIPPEGQGVEYGLQDLAQSQENMNCKIKTTFNLSFVFI